MRKSIFTTLFALLLSAGLYQEATAQFAIGPHAGFNLDAEELYIGANFRFDIAGLEVGGTQLTANPKCGSVPLHLGCGGCRCILHGPKL